MSYELAGVSTGDLASAGVSTGLTVAGIASGVGPIVSIASGAGSILGGILGLFGHKNKPKDCCDMCTGAKVGTMMSGPSCATQWRRSAACDQFVGGKLPDTMFQQYMASQGISSCADPSGGTPTNVQSGLIQLPSGQVVASSVSGVGGASGSFGQSILSFLESPLGLIAVFGGFLLLVRRK